MKKDVLVRLIFFIPMSFAVQVGLFEIWSYFFYKEKPNIVENENGEHFNPALARLSTISKFVNYCDSAYGDRNINPSDSEQYAFTVARTLRERFYHTYSYYQLGQNSLATILAPLIKSDLSAIVIPNDILKHPMAACSQQSIIGMEAFRKKGFKVRQVGFYVRGYGGHFCFETYFNSSWHFFDPDLEPKLSVMLADHFPSIAELNQNDTLLRRVYFKRDKNLVEKLFRSYSYGSVNEFPAPHARIFQYATKYLSYTLWLWVGLLYFFVQKILKNRTKKRVIEVPGSLNPIRA